MTNETEQTSEERIWKKYDMTGERQNLVGVSAKSFVFLCNKESGWVMK